MTRGRSSEGQRTTTSRFRVRNTTHRRRGSDGPGGPPIGISFRSSGHGVASLGPAGGYYLPCLGVSALDAVAEGARIAQRADAARDRGFVFGRRVTPVLRGRFRRAGLAPGMTTQPVCRVPGVYHPTATAGAAVRGADHAHHPLAPGVRGRSCRGQGRGRSRRWRSSLGLRLVLEMVEDPADHASLREGVFMLHPLSKYLESLGWSCCARLFADGSSWTP